MKSSPDATPPSDAPVGLARIFESWPLVRRFWPRVKPHQRYVWWMLVLLVLGIPLSLVSPLIIRRVVDDAVERSHSDDVLFWGLVLLGMILVSVVLEVARGYAKTLFDNKVMRDLRLDLYLHVQRLSQRYYHDKETGYLMSRQTDDVGNLHGVMADAFVRAGVDAVTAVAYLAMLFYVEWRMATGGIVLTAVIFGFQYAISPALRERTRRERETWSEVSRALHQGISGHALVRATASEPHEARRFLRVLHTSVRAAVRKGLFVLVTQNVFGLIASVAPTVIVLGGVYLIVSSDFTVGGLFAFFMYLTYMFGAVAGVARLNPQLQASLASLERIFEVLDTAPEVRSSAAALKPDSLTGEVVLDGVSFAYQDDRPVLRELRLRVPPRTMVALVGPSGAGKSTLANLLLRFFDPSSGQVLVDGHDLAALDLAWYRRRVGLVPQDIFLFDRTLAENIAYGRAGATPEEVRRAARAANALEFIDDMPQGFDTIVGEKGVKLSGGQRQRVAIAREILRDPTILILDEATSSLDSATEALIQDALDVLLAGRTSFVIAHRLSTVVRADRIVVLDDGRIVEEGRHEELLERDGLYRRLYESQFERHSETHHGARRHAPNPSGSMTS